MENYHLPELNKLQPCRKMLSYLHHNPSRSPIINLARVFKRFCKTWNLPNCEFIRIYLLSNFMEFFCCVFLANDAKIDSRG